MEIKILNRFNNSVLHQSSDFEDLKQFVEHLVKVEADLSGANLSGADLSRADLSGANLSGANLYGADLSGANLYGADLSGANLSGADLSRAYLSGANLSGANLSGADLSRANLSRAYLYGADLSGADLSGADLSRANLSGANLSGADLLLFSKWPVYFTQSENDKLEIENFDTKKLKIKIGCKEKTISEWDQWFASDEEYQTKRNTFEFKQIQGMYNAYKAYLLTVYGV